MNKTAIQKPYLINIQGQTVDASVANLISWSVTGAVSHAYSLVIKRNSDNVTLFTLAKTTSFATSYTLPAASLTNGVECKVTVQVWDSADLTATSDAVIFQTSSTPIVTVATIGTVTNSSNIFAATYAQAETVSISSWIVYLYNSTNSIVAQSTIQTTSTLSYLFNNLQTGTSYSVEFQATSAKGLIGTSGLIPFSVVYAAPNFNVDITTTNTDDAGVLLNWNVTQIIGTSTNATYVSSEKLDTRSGNVTFTPIGIPSDFTLKMWMESLSNYSIGSSQIIVSSTAPTNVNALWLYDSAQTMPKIINVSIRNIAPTNQNDLWVVDSNQTIERVVGLYIDTTTPSSANYFWFNSIDKMEESSVLNLDGDNGSIKLEYFNSTFYLVKYDLSNTRTVLSSVASAGTQFYIYIQQIGDTYNLGVQVIL